MIKLLDKRHGKMAINIGKKHTFVGINFDFTNRGSLTLDMVGHLYMMHWILSLKN